MSCPTPSDIVCPTPPIFRGETWYVLCHWMAQECHAWQVYFSAVTLLLRQTKATGGKVEIDYFGVSPRYFSGGEVIAGGQVRRGGIDGNPFYTGTEAQDAMVCDSPTGRDDLDAGSGHSHSGRSATTGPTGAATHTLDPPHRSPLRPSAGEHTFILWNTRSRNISRKSKRENALSRPYPVCNLPDPLTPLCVTKCSEFSLLYDKSLSTTKPRLYITTLELSCKSYALGAVYLDLSLPFSSMEPWYFLDQLSASWGLVNDG